MSVQVELFKGRVKGRLPKELAFQAVQKELRNTVLVEGCVPLSGPLEFHEMSGYPRTKWSDQPIYAVMDHGTCTFTAAFTSVPDQLLNEVGGGFDFLSEGFAEFDRELALRRYVGMNEAELREEISFLSPDTELFGEEIALLRTMLRRRMRGLPNAFPGMQ